MAERKFHRTFVLTDKLDILLGKMAREDDRNKSQFFRWLISEEAKRREEKKRLKAARLRRELADESFAREQTSGESNDNG